MHPKGQPPKPVAKAAVDRTPALNREQLIFFARLAQDSRPKHNDAQRKTVRRYRKAVQDKPFAQRFIHAARSVWPSQHLVPGLSEDQNHLECHSQACAAIAQIKDDCRWSALATNEVIWSRALEARAENVKEISIEGESDSAHWHHATRLVYAGVWPVSVAERPKRFERYAITCDFQ